MTRARARAGEPERALDDVMCACASARVVARVLTQLYDQVLRRTGVAAPQFALLLTLDRDGPCRQAALGRRHALDKTTISRNLRVLERNGWVRSAPGRDRRERHFALTARGRERLVAARPQWRRAQELLRAQMSMADWDRMFAVFRTITTATERVRQRSRSRRMPSKIVPRRAERPTL